VPFFTQQSAILHADGAVLHAAECRSSRSRVPFFTQQLITNF
jgi:hypothetical protein